MLNLFVGMALRSAISLSVWGPNIEEFGLHGTVGYDKMKMKCRRQPSPETAAGGGEEEHEERRHQSARAACSWLLIIIKSADSLNLHIVNELSKFTIYSFVLE